MKRTLPLILVFFLGKLAIAQTQVNNEQTKNHYRYDTDLLSSEFHAGRREAFRKEMPSNSVAIFFSNPIRNRSNDVDYDYHQDPNFYYLSGHTEPNSLLIIFKEEQTIYKKKSNEILFLEERNPMEELWTGRILGTQEAQKTLGIQTILKNEDFKNFDFSFDKLDKILLFKLNAVDDDPDKAGDLFELQNHLLSLLGVKGKAKLDESGLSAIMSKLREIKQPEELKLMRKAVAISCKGHIELIQSIHAGMNEYQAQSILEYVFKNNGAEYSGYPSIVGNGENSCVLHYTSNRKPMNSQQLLLSDAAAEYHGYSADITRTIPVDGVFSKEEKAIYDLVLEAQEAGIAACKAGNKFNASHLAAVKIIREGLVKLGIIAVESEYSTYFMHGTSHYLGLDVHDWGTEGNLKPGTIITVEPGIYIPEGSACDKKWWNIGVRIEDDILITEGEPENLSIAVPRKISEIEALMKEKGFFEER